MTTVHGATDSSTQLSDRALFFTYDSLSLGRSCSWYRTLGLQSLSLRNVKMVFLFFWLLCLVCVALRSLCLWSPGVLSQQAVSRYVSISILTLFCLKFMVLKSKVVWLSSLLGVSLLIIMLVICLFSFFVSFLPR